MSFEIQHKDGEVAVTPESTGLIVLNDELSLEEIASLGLVGEIGFRISSKVKESLYNHPKFAKLVGMLQKLEKFDPKLNKLEERLELKDALNPSETRELEVRRILAKTRVISAIVWFGPPPIPGKFVPFTIGYAIVHGTAFAVLQILNLKNRKLDMAILESYDE
jgi:hypothetical protein